MLYQFFLVCHIFFEPNQSNFTAGPIDVFRLSQHQSHFIYPALTNSNFWVFLLTNEFLEGLGSNKCRINVIDPKGKELGACEFDIRFKSLKRFRKKYTPINPFYFLQFKIDAPVAEPGLYTINFTINKKTKTIGKALFEYQKFSPFTPDQINALASDPNSAKIARFELGCKLCPTKITVYTALKRYPEYEKENWIWYNDLKSRFKCNCGRSEYSLRYLKESMHGLLTRINSGVSGLSYIRQYGHSQIAAIADKFKSLIQKENLEPPIQRFLEEHEIFFSHFQAMRLFKKPNILGKFQADFAIVDSRKQLWLIEIERPSLKLFRKDGQITQELAHAYKQVDDWLHEFNRNRQAVLDGLGIKDVEIIAVRGIVIAGRKNSVKIEHLSRHLSSALYQN